MVGSHSFTDDLQCFDVAFAFLGKMSKYFLVLNDKRALELQSQRKGGDGNNNSASVAATVQSRLTVQQFRAGIKRGSSEANPGPSGKK